MVVAAVARHLPTTTLITMIVSVRRGVVGEIVTTTTRTIIGIPMIGIIGMVTVTEIADAEVGGGQAAVGAGVILAADRIRTGAGRLGMSDGIAMVTTGDGNGQGQGPGLHTTEGGGIGTEMVADLRVMAIRTVGAGGDEVVVLPTFGKIGTKNGTAAGNKERRRVTGIVGGIVVTMIRRRGIAIVTAIARRLSVMARVEKGIAKVSEGGVGREVGPVKEEREIEWRKMKRRRNVEYNKYSSVARI